MKNDFIENRDYYYDKSSGLMILTAHYLKKRGYCCQSGCTHCPYGFTENTDPNVPSELSDKSEERCIDEYLDGDE